MLKVAKGQVQYQKDSKKLKVAAKGEKQLKANSKSKVAKANYRQQNCILKLNGGRMRGKI